MSETFDTKSLYLWYLPSQWGTEFNGKLGTFVKKGAKEGKRVDGGKVAELSLKLTLNAVIP